MGRIDLSKLAGREMFAIDVDAYPPSRPGVELRADTHPGGELRRLHQVREDGRRRRGDPLHDLEIEAALDQLFDRFLSSASASRARRSTSRSHILRRYASSGRRAARLAR